jgi:prevent-host-death family protein
MTETIGQRQLRNDNADIMRRVEQGESFIITRHGRPVADLTPHAVLDEPRRRPTLAELQQEWRDAPAVDVEQWFADRAADDAVFGADEIDP